MDNETLELFIASAKLLKCNYVMALRDCIIGTDEHFAHLTIMPHTNPKFWELENIAFETKQFTVAQNIDFSNLVYKIDEMIKRPVTLYIPSLDENEEFKNIMAKKADEGMSMINIENYLISVNKSLIPLNKSDKLDLYIRDFGDIFCGEYIIKKGKNIIKKYFLYLKL